MILKAYITEIPKIGDNIYKVRIPFMEDNTTNEMVFDALLCRQPGTYYGYKVGDCVFVSFENDKLDVPIIFGKLFVDIDEDEPTFQIVNDLRVKDKIDMPDNTTLGGYSSTDIFMLTQKAVNDEENGTNNSSLNYSIIGTWS